VSDKEVIKNRENQVIKDVDELVSSGIMDIYEGARAKDRILYEISKATEDN